MAKHKQSSIDHQRRRLVSSLAVTPALGLFSSLPGLSFAAVDGGEQRFVLVILRGAMDGLAAVAPYGDSELAGLRGSLLTAESELLKLDSFFGLHPALENLHEMYQSSQAIICHAVASPYRERSHFDGQNVLEIGLEQADQSESGWLNRCVPLLGKAGENNGSSPAMAIGQAVPDVLQGESEVASWAPAIMPEPSVSTMQRLQQLYAQDAFLGVRLEQALMANQLAGRNEMMANRRQGQSFGVLVDAAAAFLADASGPSIAVLESNGWDTHANQGASQGQLVGKFRELDRGLARLKSGLEETWNNTAVLVVTEFGRTVAVNGTQGTDHGTAGVALLLGGSVKGGSIHGQWPGLASANLYQGRDLAPTTDMRSLFKTVLRDHLQLPQANIESELFPDSADAAFIANLV
ncbi:MAG TPA: Tat pathway signal protein [Gammaproteobacteria bacterium]|nr:Tat pathway signal protein [Gammaproteobacteria bacterium]